MQQTAVPATRASADPHPGNLIRTPDGRLAILDFGLMTTVDDDIKVRLCLFLHWV